MLMEPFEISWQAPEYEHHPKDASWYWLSMMIAIIVLALAIWQRNFLFSVFIILAEVLILVWSNREPAMVEFALTDQRLTINHRVKYLLSDVEHFSIEPHDELDWPILALRFHRRFRPPLHVRAPQNLVNDIRNHLQLVLAEAPWEDSLADTLERFLRF